MSPILRFDQVSKVFPGVRALSNVSFDVHAGQVHGLMGENGAGKSTLLKILGGEYQPDGGSIEVNGQPIRFANAAASIASGVAVIHQELQYVPELSVAENLLLGRLPTRHRWFDKSRAIALARDKLHTMGVDLDPAARLSKLSIAQRQMVEICKALMRDARVIALDEPTSSLSHTETEVLFRLVRQLRAEGRALIYISHRMDEIYALCDACTVFRDGKHVASHADFAALPRSTLVKDMVGREIADIFHYRPRPIGATRLAVREIWAKPLKAPASFDVRRGEIVGFFGLVGAGRSELMHLVFGSRKAQSGQIVLDDTPIRIESPRAAIRQGIALCPEDRKEEGIVAVASVAENINMSCRRHTARFGTWIDRRKEAHTANAFIDRLKIKTSSPRQRIRLLSGGNQQKAILARWLAEPNLRVVILDEPTRGIDIGAKHDIYEVIYALAERGCSIVVVSSELPEVLGISDRVVVMREGRIAGELARHEATESAVLALALPERSDAH